MLMKKIKEKSGINTGVQRELDTGSALFPVPSLIKGTGILYRGNLLREALKKQLGFCYEEWGASVNSQELDTSANSLLSFVSLLMETDQKNGFQVLKSSFNPKDHNE